MQPRGSKDKVKKGIGHKVYLVFLRMNVTHNKQGHELLIGHKLTRSEADALAQLHPGAYIHKIIATKGSQ